MMRLVRPPALILAALLGGCASQPAAPPSAPKAPAAKAAHAGRSCSGRHPWDLGQLTLVAVVTGEANPLAMVEDPAGRGHIIRRSTRMGKQGGKVTQILRDTVTVTEFWTGPDGKVNPNPTTLHMKPDKTVVPDHELATGKKYP